MVICVYARRNYLNNEDRFFIPILAIFDLVACIVNCSEAIFGNTVPVKYNSDITCKLFWFLGMIFFAFFRIDSHANRDTKILEVVQASSKTNDP